nr:restriction endonuclease subunit S [uncultured Solibaculum sp.]
MEEMQETYHVKEVLEELAAVECLRLALGRIVDGSLRPDFRQLDDGQLALGQQPSSTDDQEDLEAVCIQSHRPFSSGELVFSMKLFNPPFGNMEESRWSGLADMGETRLETFFLRRFLMQSENEGQCCCLVPNGLLSRIHPSDEELRRQLVEQHGLQAVILLPLHAFQPRVHVYTALISFRQGGGPSKRIWLCDARKGRLEDIDIDCYFTSRFSSGLDGQFHRAGQVEHLFLTPQMLSSHHYLLVPEAHRSQVWASSRSKIQSIQEEINRLQQSIINLEQEGSDQQMDLFGGDEKAPWDKKHLGRLIQLKKQQMNGCRQMVEQLFLEDFGEGIQHGEYPLFHGKDLFVFHSGNKPSKDWPEGPYPLYDGSGIRRTLDRCTQDIQEPVIIITRVGTYCGTVYQSKQPCWVGGNAFYLEQVHKPADPSYLVGLFSYMDFNQYKVGSCIPQINQAVLLSKQYPLPSLELQKAYAAKVDPWLDQLESLEQEIYTLQQQYRVISD